MPCIHRVIHASFEHVQLGCLGYIVMLYPSMSFFATMEHPSMTQSCSTFAIKCFWQIVYVLINFAEVVVVNPCML